MLQKEIRFPEKVKEGRNIIGFNLSVVKKDRNASSNSEQIEQEGQKSYQDVEIIIEKHFGKISKSVLENIFSNYSKEYILEKITYTVERVKKETTGFYPIPYFISALKLDYKSNKIETQKITIETSSSNIITEWENKCDLLSMELNHWLKIQELQRKNNASNSALQDMQNRVDECKRNLRKHYTNKPLFPIEEGKV